MNLENVLTCNNRESYCMTSAQKEMFDGNSPCDRFNDLMKDRFDCGPLLSSKAQFAYIVDDGVDFTQKEHTDCYEVFKPRDVFGELDSVKAGGEPFLSILDRRRLAKKAEEDIECKWEQTKTHDIETVADRVLDLVSRLKKQFVDERQVRKKQKTTDHANYVWNNSVDSFLRYHEKPRVNIQYSEGRGDLPGEGLFTFAVRPSSIKKRVMKEKPYACKVPQNIKKEASHEEISDEKNEAVETEEVINNNKFVAHGKDFLDELVPSFNNGTIVGDVKGHVVYNNNTIPMILDTFYNHTLTVLHKMNTLNSNDGHVLNPNLETSSSGGHNCKSLVPVYMNHKSSWFAEIYNKSVSRTFEIKTSTGISVQFILPVDKIAIFMEKYGYTILPPITTDEVYADTTSSFCGLPTSKIYGHSVPPIPPTRLTYCTPLLQNYVILKFEDIFDNALHGLGNAVLDIDLLNHMPIYDWEATRKLEQNIFTISDLLTTLNITTNTGAAVNEVNTALRVSRNEEPSHDVIQKTLYLPYYDEKLCNEVVANLGMSSHMEPEPDEHPFIVDPTTTLENNHTEPPPVHEAITDNIVDEFDDESSFGILSVYCRSELHSWCSPESKPIETER